MSVRSKGSDRWSLLQALAWVLSRDRKLVVDADLILVDEFPRTPLWLAVRAAISTKGEVSIGSAWRQLAEALASGTVNATGCPERADGELFDRQALTIEARDLVVDGDRHTPGRHCYLAATSLAQRNWFEVEMSARDLERTFPALEVASNRGGAPARYDWPRIRAHIDELVAMHGLPSLSNRHFKTAADVEKAALLFCSVHLNAEPAEETMRGRIRKWLKELRAVAAE